MKLKKIPCLGTQPDAVFVAIFATEAKGEMHPPGTLNDAFKKSMLLFLLPLPFPSHRKNVKQNILTKTTLLNKSAQSSFEPDLESSFMTVNFYVLKMGNNLSHTPLIPHVALTLRPMVCECLRSCITINQTFLNICMSYAYCGL